MHMFTTQVVSSPAGDWMYGKKEGRGDEMSQYGNYKGAWKADLKQGYGEERSLVGTIFDGNWDKGKKNGRGVRKMIFGTTDEQVSVLMGTVNCYLSALAND